MATPAPFCGHCGRPFAEGAAFCGSCGRPRGTLAPGDRAAAPPRRVPPAPAPAPAAAAASGIVGGLAGALPWQTVLAGQAPDVGAFLGRAGVSAASTAVRTSLRRPAWALVVTTALDLVVAALAGPAALQAAWPRALVGLVTSGLGIAAGSRGGPVRTLAGLAGAVAALVGVGSVGLTLLAAADGGADPATLLPQVVTMASSLAVAARTATLALRRKP